MLDGSRDGRKMGTDAGRWTHKRIGDMRDPTEPQAEYSALTHGMISKWTYIMRTAPDIAQLMAPLEDIFKKKFSPVITGRAAITNEEDNYWLSRAEMVAWESLTPPPVL